MSILIFESMQEFPCLLLYWEVFSSPRLNKVCFVEFLLQGEQDLNCSPMMSSENLAIFNHREHFCLEKPVSYRAAME